MGQSPGFTSAVRNTVSAQERRSKEQNQSNEAVLIWNTDRPCHYPALLLHIFRQCIVYIEQSLFAMLLIYSHCFVYPPSPVVSTRRTADWRSAEPVSGSDINAYTGCLCVRLSAVAAR